MKDQEITYDQVAKILGCSPRHARRVIARSGIKPIRRGHRTVSFPAEPIVRLRLKLLPRKKSSAEKWAEAHGMMLVKRSNGKGRR